MSAKTTFREALLVEIPAMRAFARALCRDRDVADDLVQDALLSAWKSQLALRDVRCLKSWLLQIVRNTHLHAVQSRARLRAEPIEDGVDYASHSGGEDELVDGEDARTVLMKLAAPDREAIVLVVVHGLNYEEAAEVCGCPVGTIKSRVNRAKSQMRAALAQDRDERLSPKRSSLVKIPDRAA